MLVGTDQGEVCRISNNRIMVDRAHRTFMAKHLLLVQDYVAADTRTMVAVDVRQALVRERAVVALGNSSTSSSRRECPFFRSILTVEGVMETVVGRTFRCDQNLRAM